ncbi:hypothetical protein EVA_00952 [gut metagenome]|uniref:Uncharacterized protein n=1 Tax=gut metagenome TaxID=749906 RepID=J9GRR0_9ZZZZ
MRRSVDCASRTDNRYILYKCRLYGRSFVVHSASTLVSRHDATCFT